MNEDKLLKCAKDTALLEFLEKKDLILYAERNGINLSGGQKQRVAIARALYSKKKYYFLMNVRVHSISKLRKSFLQNIFTSYKEKTIISITQKKILLSI